MTRRLGALDTGAAGPTPGEAHAGGQSCTRKDVGGVLVSLLAESAAQGRSMRMVVSRQELRLGTASDAASMLRTP